MTNPETDEVYYTLREVARILRLDPRTIATKINSGKFPGKKIGIRYRISKTQLEEYMNEPEWDTSSLGL